MIYTPTTNTITIYADSQEGHKLKLYKSTTYIGTYYPVLNDGDDTSVYSHMYVCNYSTVDVGSITYTYKIYNENNYLETTDTQSNTNCCYPRKPYLSNPEVVGGSLRFDIGHL